MKLNLILLMVGSALLSACSGSDNSAATNKTDTVVETKAESGSGDNVLLGYKRTLDSVKATAAMAEESERQKNQAIQDLDN